MRTPFKLFCCVITLFLINTSCSKSDISPHNVVNVINVSVPPALPSNREYFWDQSWQKTSTGYEMKLQTQRLTDSVINQGIQVSLAIYSEMTVFEILPSMINDPSLPDTINLSYTATPGELKVFAKTTVNITWQSDVSIVYK